MNTLTLGPSEIDMGIISDFYNGEFNRQIENSKLLIYELYNSPEEGITSSKFLKIKELRISLTEVCNTYKKLVQKYQNYIIDNFSLNDMSILKRNFNAVVHEIDAINELYVSFEIHRLSHNIISFGYSGETVEYLQIMVDNAEALEANYLEDKIHVIQNYIDEQRRLKY